MRWPVMWDMLVRQVAGFRKRLEKVVGDKHEDVMGRMGAIMATGATSSCPLHTVLMAHQVMQKVAGPGPAGLRLRRATVRTSDVQQ